MAGEEFKVQISLSSDKAEDFNAYRFTLSFNTTKLEYVSISDAASTVELDGGKLVIYGIGADRSISDTITLTFKALKSGITEVKLVQVEMDKDASVTLETLPLMNIGSNAAVIDVQKAAQEQNDVVGSDDGGSAVIWIIIGVAAVLLIAGGVVVLILLKKKKQTPATEN